ncbi:hypothetical protein BFG60_0158 [Microcystis aeruginosa NIES-98]|nr:hypothetical protein BFG60_0158 [Microcystis aeruginosa NIES-98]
MPFAPLDKGGLIPPAPLDKGGADRRGDLPLIRGVSESF